MKKNLAMNMYEPAGDAKGVLLIVHGMMEHRKRYDEFATYLQGHGIIVMVYDLPGHGESVENEKEFGYFGDKDGWDVLVNASVTAIKQLKQRYPHLPIWYLGHSMGSMIGRCFLQENDALIDGMILTGAPCYNALAPLAKVIVNTTRLIKGKKGHTKSLDKLFTGAFNKAIQNPKTPYDWLSYRRENIDNYIKDPLCGKPFTVQGYHDLTEGMLMMQDGNLYLCSCPELPIYFFAGKDDPCTGGSEGLAESEAVLKKAGYTNIHTKTYDMMRHEILNEDDRQTVYEDILKAMNLS